MLGIVTLEQAKANLAYSQSQGDPLDADSAQVLRAAGISLNSQASTGTQTVAIQPTTEAQIFNTIDLVAQGILNERVAKQNVAMTQAQAQAAAEQAKAAATNYVMTSLQKGDTVLVSKSAVQTPTWASWSSKILLIGGVAVLAYVLWRKFGKKRAAPVASTAPVAANPRRRKKHRR